MSNSKDFEEKIILGSWTENDINNLIDLSKSKEISGERIDYISKKFLNTRYMENTLTGNNSTKEMLTINFDGVDCFTYIDYVQSLNLSSNYDDFKNNLIKLRYKEGIVDYKKRNHFFSDWTVNNSKYIHDITSFVGSGTNITKLKVLNKKNIDSVYLEGIPLTERNITYIPTNKINKDILDKLKTGDYIGIYSLKEGLDVSHTGIIIKNNSEVLFRHASSKSIYRKVVDENLMEYIKDKPGIIVYRSL
ncbi:MAG: DUF1460 domain-containing protein [Candidatus Dadabacteria bacterium]|nr:DUF1460 domain-containing protein [Candidatus Dadabacteria bacterium]NIQ15757.1 DUF1460 domain-containing protein [Candidatus Dadabacteria bacterium]